MTLATACMMTDYDHNMLYVLWASYKEHLEDVYLCKACQGLTAI